MSDRGRTAPPLSRRWFLLGGVVALGALVFAWTSLPIVGAVALRRRFTLAVLRSRMAGLGFADGDLEAFADDWARTDRTSAWSAWGLHLVYPIYRIVPGVPRAASIYSRECDLTTRFLMRSTFFAPRGNAPPRYLGHNPYEATPCMNPFARRPGNV